MVIPAITVGASTTKLEKATSMFRNGILIFELFGRTSTSGTETVSRQKAQVPTRAMSMFLVELLRPLRWLICISKFSSGFFASPCSGASLWRSVTLTAIGLCEGIKSQTFVPVVALCDQNLIKKGDFINYFFFCLLFI